MTHAELDRLEGDVQDARQRLKSDLEVLRAPETFSTFKDEVVAEARQSGNDAIANAKAGVTTWSERLITEIKERAAANPIAVAAIAAGIGWRIVRNPPITTMLVGYGLYSLFRTQPGQLAPGAETVYQAADAAVAAKEQVQQWSREAGETVAEATGSVQAVAANVSESTRRFGADVSSRIAGATGSLQAITTSGSQNVQRMAVDRQQRDKVLLGAAAVALTTAIGLVWLRRSKALGGAEPTRFSRGHIEHRGIQRRPNGAARSQQDLEAGRY
jgi:hypothetical protein